MTEAILKLLADHPKWEIRISREHRELSAIKLKIVAPFPHGVEGDVIRMVDEKAIALYKGGDFLGENLKDLQGRMEHEIEKEKLSESQV